MKCSKCGKPSIILMEGSLCKGCYKPARIAVPRKRKRRSGKPAPPTPYKGEIPKEQWHMCGGCLLPVVPRPGEYPIHYFRRQTCDKSCYTLLLQKIRLGNQNARKE